MLLTPSTSAPPSMLPAELRERLLRHVALVDEARESIPVRAPFTGEVLGAVPRGTAADVREATRRARVAQADWAERSFVERAQIFLRYHDLVIERRDEVLDLIQAESGKARKHAFEEVADVAIVARYYAHSAEQHLRSRRRQGAIPGLTAAWEHHHPRGLIGFIAPWNYPLSMAITDAIPALMAGNAALLKPDLQTPFTALWAVDLLYEAGLPEGLLQVVTGEGPELGPTIIEQVDFLAFTGSTRTGRIVARQAAERLIPCSLELGGKNSMIVLADADLGNAVDGAIRGVFASAGQLCISIERILVQESIYEEFAERFVAATLDLRVGPGDDYEIDMGSLVSERQMRTVVEHVEDARAKGAAIITGGRTRSDLGPLFYEPTVLEEVTPEMRVYAEETFGPVVSLYPFRSLDRAIERANDTRYGLNASVWTGDTELGQWVAERLEAGTVNVNEAYAAAWASVDAPMGGFKDSGIGRRHGREGILKYTQSQTVAVQRGVPIGTPPGVGEERFTQLFSGALKMMRRIPGIR